MRQVQIVLGNIREDELTEQLFAWLIRAYSDPDRPPDLTIRVQVVSEERGLEPPTP